jgi:hypothetical protein
MPVGKDVLDLVLFGRPGKVLPMNDLKRLFFERLFHERGYASISVDLEDEGVILPERARAKGAEGTLQLDYTPNSSKRLVVDESGISATLSFDQESAETFVPFSAIYVVRSFDRLIGAQWLPLPRTKRKAPEAPEAPTPKRPRLKVV